MAALASPRFFENIVVPGAVTLVVHAVAILLLFWSWQTPSLTVKRDELTVMHARVVQFRQKATSPEPKPAARAPRQKPASRPAQPEPKAAPEPQATAPAQSAPAPTATPEPKAPAEAAPKPVAPPAVSSAEDLAAAVAAEEDFQQQQAEAAEEEAMVASYHQLIKAAVESNWSRPPSARRDMSATVRIQMIPTGEVITTTLIEGSDNAAFDRSVLQAIQKAQPFAELKGMPPAVFDKYFRQFNFVFKPKDLRR